LGDSSIFTRKIDARAGMCARVSDWIENPANIHSTKRLRTMKLMKEQPVLTVGVASGAMAILLLALGSIQGPADDASPRPVRRPGPTTLVIEGALRPGMEIYAADEASPGLVRVGRVLRDAGDATPGGADRMKWPMTVAESDRVDF
jgi:hypothetical protein